MGSKLGEPFGSIKTSQYGSNFIIQFGSQTRVLFADILMLLAPGNTELISHAHIQ